MTVRVTVSLITCSFLFTEVKDLGKVAGAVVGISLGVLIVILIIWLVFRKKEKKKYEEEETPNEIRFIYPPFFSLFPPSSFSGLFWYIRMQKLCWVRPAVAILLGNFTSVRYFMKRHNCRWKRVRHVTLSLDSKIISCKNTNIATHPQPPGPGDGAPGDVVAAVSLFLVWFDFKRKKKVKYKYKENGHFTFNMNFYHLTLLVSCFM